MTATSQKPLPLSDAAVSIEEYTERIKSVSNATLIKLTSDAIMSDTVMTGMRNYDGRFGNRCSALYSEAVNRANADLYDRGYNRVARSQGLATQDESIMTPIDAGDPTLPQAAG